jgi:class 3 adenylate cyclase
MDRHDNVDAAPEDIAHLHELDLEVQAKHDVNYLSYWFDPEGRSVFCFVDAPSREAAEAVHAEAHGEVASRIIEVEGRNAVMGFLGPIRDDPSVGPPDSGFRAILFTDIVESTQLTQQLGDVKAMELVRTHDQIVRGALAEVRGSEVKHTGDGIMASFLTATAAIECAIAIQRGLDTHARDAEHPITVRIGMSAGEPVAEHDDLFGAAVQLAARACAHAEAGAIFVSNAVRELCVGKNFAFDSRGPFELKGFAEPVPLFEVAWRQSSS